MRVARETNGGQPVEKADAPMERRVRRIAVREIVEFSLRTGSLRGVGQYRSVRRARLGTEWHRRIQAGRPADYLAEVPVERLVLGEDVDLRVEGRIDGVLPSRNPPLIEEIKSVQGWEAGGGEPLHWAQARVYAAMWCAVSGAERVEIQLTYVEWESGQLNVLRRMFEAEELECFFQSVASSYLSWVERWERQGRERDESLASLHFPFPEPRCGQDLLIDAVENTIADGGILLAEAATGIGKSVGTLYPALLALGRGEIDRVVYLTARSAGREAARAALERLREAGARISVLFLTARERICFRQDGCESGVCRYCEGYFDRIGQAREEAAALDFLDEVSIAVVARRHQVCPFALSLEVAPWVDVVIADYNYVFSPRIRLQCFGPPETQRSLLLVDEAHHLADRAREVYSAELEGSTWQELRDSLGSSLPGCRRAAEEVIASLRTIRFSGECALETCPDRLPASLERFRVSADEWLLRGEDAGFRELLLETYFSAGQFLRPGEVHAPDTFRYVWRPGKSGGRLRCYCLDPAPHLAAVFENWRAAVFFSGTLRPAEYWARVWGLGGRWAGVSLGSPFPPEHLEVLVHRGVPTQYRARLSSLPRLVAVLEEFLEKRPGCTLIFFPSYEYLRAVAERLQVPVGVRLVCQDPGMSLEDQRRFLDAFDGVSRTAGLAVMGGLFGEGIDLAGARLTGVVVVGLGLPGIGIERDLQGQYYDGCTGGGDEASGRGYHFAYLYPGITRVLQAVGRLIRTEEDRGTAMLIDPRYGAAEVRELLPGWWRVRDVVDGEAEPE